jgi:hypothetical protein
MMTLTSEEIRQRIAEFEARLEAGETLSAFEMGWLRGARRRMNQEQDPKKGEERNG